MKSTVAIVGSHPKTSRDFNFDRTDCDIWAFNEALKTDWCKRADGIFQIHKPIIWRSRTNKNDPDHYKWLQEQNESIVYMIDQYQDVPKSEKYPLDEIIKKFWNAEKYFTSSVAYALALAIYKGYGKIEIYGVEMETGTEYGHQRVGVAYWIGFAEGQGIEIDFHGSIFNAPLYGYDGDTRVPIEFFEERMKKFEPHIKAVHEQIEKLHKTIKDKLDAFIKSYKTDITNLDEVVMAFGQNSYNWGLWSGGHMVVRGYANKCKVMIEESGDYLIARQEYEGAMIAASKGIAKVQPELQRVGIELKHKRDALNTNENQEKRERLVKDFAGKLNAYHKASYEMGKLTGMIKESQLIMKKYDELIRALGMTNKQEIKAPENKMVEMPV
mgnify:CR=1 FL=1